MLAAIQLALNRLKRDCQHDVISKNSIVVHEAIIKFTHPGWPPTEQAPGICLEHGQPISYDVVVTRLPVDRGGLRTPSMRSYGWRCVVTGDVDAVMFK